MFADFHFLRPEWLLGIPLVIAGAILLSRRRLGLGGWQNVVDPALAPHVLARTASNRSDYRWWLFGLAGVIALTAMAGRGLADLGGAELEAASQRETMLAFVVFTIPLVLFSLPAGVMADRLSKRTIILGMKALELTLMSVGTALLWWRPEASGLALIVLGGMGVQSALFSPAKLGSIPEMLPVEKISSANGLIGLTTVVATVVGMPRAGLSATVFPAAPSLMT